MNDVRKDKEDHIITVSFDAEEYEEISRRAKWYRLTIESYLHMAALKNWTKKD